MGRTVVRQLDPPRERRSRDNFLVVGIGVVLLLAILGLVSAGIFVAGKFSSSSHPAKAHHPGTGSSVAVADLARAQAQATAIVKAAHDAGTSIVHHANTNAHRQAAAIVAAAQRRAQQIAAQPAPTAVVVAPAPPVTSVQQSTVPPTTGSGSTSTGVTSPGVTSPSTGITTPSTGVVSAPNLGNLPASWLVVGYNASFGSGPGSAGSISVINRSGKTFSGVAVVKYTTGGTSSAPFSGLAPGQSLVLPLNGDRYNGGGYRILVNVH